MGLSMLSKITQMLIIGLALCTTAQAQENGRFTLVPSGALVPFEATCFDAQATARLLTWKEFIEQEQRALCEFEKERLTLDTNLIIENLEITLDETNERCQIEINTRDKELEELRGIIKKNRKINMPAVIISSVVGGIAVGIGGTYAIDQLLDK